MTSVRSVFILVFIAGQAAAQTQPVTIPFKAVVGPESFACGHSYAGIGTTKSAIQPEDFRFYVHNFRLIDETGKEVPVQLDQDDKWQLDDVALLDFEDGTGRCSNGTPETNAGIAGVVPTGHRYRGLVFTLGVPFDKNHTDLTAVPSPLNLTAMAWVWNAGRKFMRVEFASTGKPRGNLFHLGSTGCTPNATKTTSPTSCLHPNRIEVSLPDFDPVKDRVVVDLAALLQKSNVDATAEGHESGCMSSADDPDCAPLFAGLGIAFSGEIHRQKVFRLEQVESPKAAALARQ